MIDIPFVLLAGGLATRLHPITKTIPKSLVMVAGKPFLQHQLELLNKYQVKHVVLCIGHFGYMIEETFGDQFLNIKLTYSYDGDVLLGTGGAINRTIDKLGDRFAVMYGDSYLPLDYAKIVSYFDNHHANGLMTLFLNNHLYDTSNVVFENGQILKYNKNDITPDMKYIDYGFAIYRKEAFAAFPKNEKFDLSNVIIRLIENNQLIGYEVFERFYEIGSITGLTEFELKIQTG